MNKLSFGTFLAQLRNEKNLTQERLAEKINVNYKTISKWECGNCLPDLQTLVKLAKIFNVSLYELTVEHKRLTNPFITKNNIKKIIDKSSKKKFVFINIILFILFILSLIFTIYCYLYTINNYNQMQIYELSSTNQDFYIEGIFVKNNNNFYFSINNIEYLHDTKNLINDKTKSLKYTITSKQMLNIHNIILLDSYHPIIEIISTINHYSTGKIHENNIDFLTFKINYKNQDNIETALEFNINLVKKESNKYIFF